MDTDDEEWLAENPEWEDYIDYQYAEVIEMMQERPMNELQKAQQRSSIIKSR